MHKKINAFTLIELLIVISIVGIISGAVIVQMNGAINAVNDSTKKTDLNTIKKALTIYQAETGNSLPVESGCTIGSCSNLDSALGDFLPDSFANTYTYSSNGTSYTVSSVLSSGYAYQYNSATNEYSTLEPSNGACGSANNTGTYTIPSSNLCSAGTASSVSGSGPWNWTCAGSSGGSTASCSADLSVNGVCGTKNGKYAVITPTGTEACTAGTISGMTGSYSWTCTGANGGTSPSCATVAASYAAQSFTSSTTWTVPTGVTSVEYLVVGGGGSGGGIAGGGGGAGGVRTGTSSISSLGGSPLTVTVGAGGTAPASYTLNGNNGGYSALGNIQASGGGGGGTYNSAGLNGGSGGGGGGSATMSGGLGNAGGYSPVEGYGGGYGYATTVRFGGGGGGAGAAGAAGAGSTGAGGVGISSSISGAAVYYGGGGGGGTNEPGYLGAAGGNGGGGAGACGSNSGSCYPVAGSANTGGGGGGAGDSYHIGAAGGSGIVIVRYINNY